MIASLQARYYRTSPVPGAHWVALAALGAIALATFVSRDVTRIGEILAVVLGLVSALHMRRHVRHWWLLAVFFVYLAWILFVDLVVSITPDDVNVERFQRRYLKQYFFFFAGWWVGAARHGPQALVSLGIAGCLIGLAVLGGADDWARPLAGRRADFGFHNAQHTALYFSTVLLGVVYLGGEALGLRRRSLRIGCIAVCLAVGALAIVVLDATQTRQTWVALGAGSLVGLVACLVALRRRTGALPGTRRSRRAAAAVAVVVLGALVVANPLDGAWERTQSELDNVAALLSGERPATYGSTSTRLLQWQAGLAFIAERPVTGYGGGANGTLMERSDLPRELKDDYGHFHNSYLEHTLHYGAVGTALWLTGLVVLGLRVSLAVRRGRLSGHGAFFAAGWLGYFAAVNAFESYINYDSGFYVLIIAGGAIYGLTAAPRWVDPGSASTAPWSAST